jgi:hypothetical protein
VLHPQQTVFSFHHDTPRFWSLFLPCNRLQHPTAPASNTQGERTVFTHPLSKERLGTTRRVVEGCVRTNSSLFWSDSRHFSAQTDKMEMQVAPPTFVVDVDEVGELPVRLLPGGVWPSPPKRARASLHVRSSPQQSVEGQDRELALAWKDVSFTVREKSKDPVTKEFKTKTLLDKVSGVVQPGEILAVMGPSGQVREEEEEEGGGGGGCEGV